MYFEHCQIQGFTSPEMLSRSPRLGTPALKSKSIPAFLPLVITTPRKLTTPEGKQHKGIQEEELHDVKDHAAKGDLQRSEMRIDAEDVHQFEEAAG